MYYHTISADKCFEVNNTVKNEKSNINADLEIASTQHSRARLVLILIHDCYFIVTIHVNIKKTRLHLFRLIIEKKQISHSLELNTR